MRELDQDELIDGWALMTLPFKDVGELMGLPHGTAVTYEHDG
jgi:hypothetical protein